MGDKFSFSIFFFKSILIYLAALALGLCYCMLAFSSCGEPGLLFAVVRGFLTAGASLVVEHGLGSCETWA